MNPDGINGILKSDSVFFDVSPNAFLRIEIDGSIGAIHGIMTSLASVNGENIVYICIGIISGPAFNGVGIVCAGGNQAQKGE